LGVDVSADYLFEAVALVAAVVQLKEQQKLVVLVQQTKVMLVVMVLIALVLV